MSTSLAELPKGRLARPSLLQQHAPQGRGGRANPLPARPYDATEARGFLDAIWRPGEVREVRIPKHNQWGHTAAGYFDSAEALVAAAARWDGKANIYVTLNPVNPALLARAKNRIVAKAETTTSDMDVLERRWLFLDIDATRPSGISSSDQELSAAHEVLLTLTGALSKEEWPDPITCLSGNGYYALYPLALPNTPESLCLVERALRGLAGRFDTPQAAIDTSVANAARIACLVGTLKVKGDSTGERPHRRSQLLSVPDALLVVGEDQLVALAADPPQTRIPRGSLRQAVQSLPDMLGRQSIEYREQPADAGGITWYHVRRCPFHDDGRDFECGVGQKLPDGPYAGKCFHPEGKAKGWQDWKRALGLDTRPSPSPVRDGDQDQPRASGFLFARTDAGNAELLVHLHCDHLRYDHRRNKWFTWRGHHWGEDADGEVARLALETARERYRRAETIAELRERQDEARFAIASENRPRLEAMLSQARSLYPIATAGADWNRDPLMLGVANGVVDLRTGGLLAGRQADGITLSTSVPFDPEALCPRWDQFLTEVFKDDESLIEFVLLAAGYTLTGLTDEQCFFLLHGQGANGKSIFLSILRRLLGSYAYNAPFSTFELRARNEISNDVAALASRRLVTASETNAGTRLNEARIKALTGGDTMTARFLYGENFSFQPEAKFFLAVNHLPLVDDVSIGFWRRVRLVPFLRTFTTDADRGLEDKLARELPGILAWAVKGALRWQKGGLTSPAPVLAATEEYRQASDPFSEFVGDCLVSGDSRILNAAQAYDAYKSWARSQGWTDREILSGTKFGIRMSERFAWTKRSAGKLYLGVGLKDECQAEAKL